MDKHILCVGKLSAAGYDWSISPLPPVEDVEAVDGELQRTIDEMQQTLDYEDDIEDREWHARGQW